MRCGTRIGCRTCRSRRVRNILRRPWRRRSRAVGGHQQPSTDGNESCDQQQRNVVPRALFGAGHAVPVGPPGTLDHVVAQRLIWAGWNSVVRSLIHLMSPLLNLERGLSLPRSSRSADGCGCAAELPRVERVLPLRLRLRQPARSRASPELSVPLARDCTPPALRALTMANPGLSLAGPRRRHGAPFSCAVAWHETSGWRSGVVPQTAARALHLRCPGR